MRLRKIKYQFFLLSGVIALILVVVSCVGYYTSYRGLEESIADELSAVADKQSSQLDAWVQQKIGPAIGAAALFNRFGDPINEQRIEGILSLSADDDDIVGLLYTDEAGNAFTRAGRREAGYDPRTRPWYQQAKQENHLFFTDIYKDARTGEPALSAVVPFKNANGSFRGAVCEDISLKSLDKAVSQLKWHNIGEGSVIGPKGMFLASEVQGLEGTNVKDDAALSSHFEEMKAKGQGFFEAQTPDGVRLIAYQIVPTTGWLVTIGVPKSAVYAPLARLRVVYIILTLLGLALTLLFSWRLSLGITSRISRLGFLARVMAQGDLQTESTDDPSPDELGDLSRAFHQMKNHLRQLVHQIVQASGQIASSSEELTATTQQSAEASASSAQSVSEVAHGVSKQTEDMRNASQEVVRIYHDIEGFTQTAEQVTKNSEAAKEAAKQGSTLMAHALQSMDAIDNGTKKTAEVIARLGESQGQIGEIVDTISAIAQQTNLLALNAAIEAARAGEQGRGFAVVADEVRKLAGESSKSAEEIRNRIAKIQADTQAAVTSMQTGQESVAQGTGAIRDVDTQFTGILKKVEAIHGQMAGINQTAKELASSAKSVVHSIEGVERVAQETSGHAESISAATEEQNASTEEIAAAARELAHMAEDLQGATSRFKV